MFKKTILFLLVCILSLQIFPVQWLTMLADNGYTMELATMNEADEDADDEPFKDKKVNLFESDIVLFNTNEAEENLLKCTHVIHARTSNHCCEVLCPPPNFI